MVKTGQQLSGLFATRSATGALTASTGAPVGALYVDGVVNGAGVSITGSNPYKWTVTLPALTAGQVVSIYITATISAIATGGVVFDSVSDTNRLSDIAITAGTGYVTAASVEGDINGDLDGDVHGSVDGVTGNVNGKVLGGGVGVITGTGARVVDASGNNVGTLANQTTILARIGAFTGTGINTVLGFLRALGAKAAGLTPTDLSTGTTYDNTTDSQEAIADSLGGGATPASLWAYATRTLTQSAAQVIDIVSGSSITVQRGDTLVVTLTGIGNIAAYVSLDFTVKVNRDDPDSAAIIKIRKNASGVGDGLLYFNGAVPALATGGSIAINNAALGNITITLAASHTDDLVPMQGLFYDIQMITATTVQTMTSGTFNVSADVTLGIV